MSKQTPLNPNADLNAIGTVKALESADGALAAAWGVKAGSTRLLEVGDGVFAGEVVRTAPETLLTLAMNDGTELAVNEESETLLDAATYEETPEEKPSLYQRALDRLTGKKEIEIEPSSSTDPDVDALQKALLAGADPSQLEATAAGPAAGGAGNEGSSFVMLQRSGQATTPESGYDTDPIGVSFSLPEQELLLEQEAEPQPPQTPLSAAASNSSVAESALNTVLSTGSQPGSGPVSSTGTVQISGTGPFVASFPALASSPSLTSKGQPIEFEVSPDGTTLAGFIVLDGNRIDILSVTLSEGSDGGWSYTFTLLDQIDHAPGGGDLQAFDIGIPFEISDVNGNTTASSFTVSVADDRPEANSESAALVFSVDESGLSGASGGDLSSGIGGSTQDDETGGLSGSLSSLFTSGADEDITIGLRDVTSDLPRLLSNGVELEYEVSQDPVDGSSTLTATAGPGGSTVFELVVNTDGSWTLDLQDQLDHVDDATNSENTALRTVDGSVDTVDFSSILTATDADGDSIDGSETAGFTISVKDDIPVASSDPASKVSGEVQEDGLSGANDQTGQGQAEIVSGASQNLNTLFEAGADEPVSSIGMVDQAGLDTALNAGDFPQLYSGGVPLTYSVAGNTLTATAGTTPTFTLTVNDDGSWAFQLEGQLDHVAGDGENTLLRTSASDPVGVASIDLSAILTATDADGDEVDGATAGWFTIAVVDDIPVATGVGEEPLVSGSAAEDGLAGANGYVAGADLASGAAGSLNALFSAGADEPLSEFGLSDTTSGLATLYSGGEALVYSVSGDTLTATAGTTTVFTLTVNADGSWTFDLEDQLDHVAGDGENTALRTSPTDTTGVSGIDFSSLITAEDADGDTVSGVPAGAFVVTVQDDIPVAADDADSVTADSALVADGNVLTGTGGSDVNATDGVADTYGADGLGSIAWTGINQDGTTITGTYGTLTVDADGNYSYALNAEHPAVIALDDGEFLANPDTFTYTLTDGDLDTDTATLTVAVGGSNDGPKIVTDSGNPEGANDAVYESGLPSIGSGAGATTTTVDGTFTVSDPDGLDDIASVTIAGGAAGDDTFTVAQLASASVQSPLTVAGDHGTLSITGYSNGVATYSYTLTSPTADLAGVENDTFSLTTTDGTATSDPASIVIDIVDDLPVAVDDADSVTADSALVADGNVLTGTGGSDVNATDGVADTYGADGLGSIAWTGINQDGTTITGTYGTLTVDADGNYSYALNAEHPAVIALDDGEFLANPDTFTYTLTDGDLDTDTATLTVAVGGSNDGPKIVTDSGNPEGANDAVYESGLPSIGSGAGATTTTVDGTFTVSDPDGLDDIASVTIAGGAAGDDTFTVAQLASASVQSPLTVAGDHGTLSITGYSNGVATYSYTLTSPTADLAGVENDTFSLTTTDGTATSDPASIVIDIVDDLPVAVDDADSVTADSALVADGNVLTGTGGSDVNATDGVADTYGADGLGSIAWTGINQDGTTITGTYGTLTVDADGNYSYALNAEHPAVIALDDGEFLANPDTFTYTLTDGDLDTDTATLTVAVGGSNDGPKIVTDSGNPEGANDTVYEAGLPSIGSGAGATTTTVDGTFTVSDPDGLDDIASVTIAGGAAGDDTFTVAQLASASVQSPLTVAGDHGTLSITGYSNGVATYSYTLTSPTTDLAGVENDTFSLTTTDGTATSDPASIVIDIVDDLPVAVDDADSVTADSALVADGNVLTGTGGSDVNATDGVADTYGTDGLGSIAWTGINQDGTTITGTYGTLTVDADGNYSYALNAEHPAVIALDDGEFLANPDTFTYTLTDGDLDTDTATLTVAVGGSNDGPKIVTDSGNPEGANDAVYESGLPSIGSGAGATTTTVDGTFTVSDPDGLDDIASVTIAGGAAGDDTFTVAQLASASVQSPLTVAGDHGTLSITGYSNGVATYSYTLTSPTTDLAGVENDTFSLTTTDGTATSDPASIVIDIVDDLPVARDDADSVTEDGATVADGNVLTGTGGSDVNATDGVADTYGADGLGSITWANVAAGEVAGDYGTLTVNAAGNYTYTLTNSDADVQALDSGESLTENFSYTLEDGDGDTHTATLEVTINGASDGPEIETDSGNPEGANDVVYEAGLANGSGVGTTTTTVGGIFTVSDPDGLDDIVSVTIAGGPAGDDTFTVAQLASASVQSPLTVAGDHGTLSITGYSNGVATYSYTLTSPTTDLAGVENDTFSLTTTDGTATSDPASIVIDIVDDVPVARDDADSVTEDGATVADGNVLTGTGGSDANTTDGVADTYGADGLGSITWANVAAGEVAGDYGTLTVNAAGNYTYTLTNSDADVQALDSGESLTENFSYTLEDGDGDTHTATLEVTINGANDGPKIVTDSGNPEGANDTVYEAGLPSIGSGVGTTTTTVDGTFTVSDPDGLDDIASVTIAGGPAGDDTFTVAQLANASVQSPLTVAGDHGTLSITGYSNGVATYSYTLTSPTTDLAGVENDTFSLTTTDGTATSDPASIVIDIVDDLPVARDDADSVTEDGATVADGNVLTGTGGSDANTTDGVADTYGADGLGSITWANVAAGEVAGDYGTLTVSAAGNYTYTLTNSDADVQALDSGESLTENFSYTLEDGDGDTHTATLEVTINGANDGPKIVTDSGNPEGANDTVYEAGLPSIGSGVGTTTTTVDGTFTVSDPDGLDDIASVTIAGGAAGDDTFTVAQLANASVQSPLTVAGDHGTLSITGYSNGVATYSYTLTSATTDLAGVENDTFSLTTTDGTATSDPASIVIDIVDDLPVARDDADSVTEDGATVADGNVLTGTGGSDVNATDGVADTYGADGLGSITWANVAAGEVAGDYGTLTVNAAGNYTYTLTNSDADVQALDSGESLTENFSYTLEDGDGDTHTATLEVTINGANDGPKIVTDSGNPEGANDTVYEAGLPSIGSGVGTTTTTVDGTFTVSDPDGLDDIASVTIAGGAAGDDTFTVAQLANASVQSPLTVAGDHGTLSITGYSNGVATYSYTLTSATTDLAGVENDTFSLTTTDGTATSDPASIVIDIVDDLPVARDDADSVTEDGATVADGNVLTGTGGSDVNATDGVADTYGADGLGSITWANVAAGEVAGDYGTLTVNAAGNYTYTLTNSDADVQALDSGESLTENFSYTLEDGDGDTHTATLEVTINGANDGPKIVTDSGNPEGANDTVYEAGLPSIGSGVGTTTTTVDGTFTVSDPDGLDDIASVTIAGGAAGDDTFTVAQLANASVQSPLTVAGDHGTLSITGYSNGVATYSYTLTSATTDLAGVENDTFSLTTTDGTATSDPASIVIDIVDDLPVARDDADSVTEDGATVADGNVLTGTGGSDVNATDGVADTYGADGLGSITWANVAAGEVAGDYGTLTVNAAGNYTYTLTNSDADVQALDSGESLTENFSYTLEDGDGDTHTATLEVTINGANDGPKIVTDSGNPEGANDTVYESGLPSIGSGAGATTTTVDGTFTVSDPDGLDDIASVTIAGGAAGDDTFTVAQLASASVQSPLTVAGDHGTLSITGYSNGVATYSYTLTSPTADLAGVENDTFSLTTTDGTATSDPASIVIDIVDDVPVARDDADSVTEDGATVADGNVLTGTGGSDANTTDGVADTYGADGLGSITWANVAAGEVAGDYGTLTVSAAGNYTYTLTNSDADVQALDSGESLTENFSYTLEDGDGDTHTATLEVTINGANDGPKIVTDSGNPEGANDTVYEAGLPSIGSGVGTTTTTVDGTFTVSDPDGLDDIASVTIAGGPAGDDTFTVAQLANASVQSPLTVAGDHGTLSITGYSNGVATYSYTLTSPTTDLAGVENDTFSLTTTDGTATSDPASIVIDIVDDLPVARDDADSVTEDGATVADGNVLTGTGGSDANTTDGVADTYGADGLGSITWANVAAGEVAGDYGTLTVSAAGNYTYTLTNSDADVQALDSGESLTENFSYTLEDGDGDTHTATLEVTINGANDGPKIVTDSGNPEGANDTVYESGLPSIGSGAGATTTTVDGTFTVSDPDGLDDIASVTIAGGAAGDDTFTVAQLANASVQSPLTVAGDHGTLSITGYSNGVATYSYTLTSPTTDLAGVENDTFSLTTTDGTATSDPASIVIDIVDDLPVARDDADSVTEDGATVADGNVLTGTGGSDANTTDGVADTYGADGLGSITWANVAAGEVAGDYGTLTVSAAGNYTYTLTNSDADVQALDSGESLTENFSYTLEDGDGDTHTATLEVTINGANDGPKIVTDSGNPEGANDTVYEAGLPSIGSGVGTTTTTVDGTFTVSDPDGLDDIASVTIAGGAAGDDTFTVAQLANASVQSPLTVAGDHGTLSITGYSNGVATYSYTLTSPTTDLAGVENDTFSLTTTDGTATSDPASIVIDIVDDVPVARDDADSVTEDGATVADGNVLTGTGGSDANTTDGVADTYGADGLGSITWANVAAGEVAGDYGTLTVNAAGNYTYTLTNSDADVQALDSGESLTENFSYTLEDGDGDTHTATLEVTINGANDGPKIVTDSGNPEGANDTVYEAGLPSIGSGVGTTTTTVDGTFTVSDPDGLDDIASVTIAGGAAGDDTFTVGQLANASVQSPLTVAGDHGTLSITGYSNGVATYSYTLTSPTTDLAGVENDTFSLTTTDGTATSDPASIVIDIVDDVPSVELAATGATLVLDESVGADPLDSNANDEEDSVDTTDIAYKTASASSLFTYVTDKPGADGEASRVFSLVLAAGASGLTDTASGDPVILSMVGDDIIGAAGGEVVLRISIDESNGDLEISQYRALEHAGLDHETPAVSIASGLISLRVTLEDADGDTDFSSIELGSMIRFEDDGPVISGIEDGQVAKVVGASTSGDIDLDLGTDIESDSLSFDIGDSSKIPEGLTYSTSPTGSVLTATDASGDTVFTVTLNENPDGSFDYDFEVVKANPTTQQVLNVSGFNPTNNDWENVQTIDQGSVVFKGFDTSSNTEVGVNASNSDLGVSDNQIHADEMLQISFTNLAPDYFPSDPLVPTPIPASSFTEVYNIQTRVEKLNNGESFVWKAYDLDLQLIAQGTYVSTLTGNQPIDFDLRESLPENLVYGGEFAQLTLESGSSTTFKVTGITVEDSLFGENESLEFVVNAVDGDGDVTTDEFQVDLYELLMGSAGADEIIGSRGDDTIDGAAGADTINAGAGNDTIIYDSNDVVIDGGEAADGSDTSDDMDTLLIDGNLSNWAAGLDNIERLSMVDSNGDDAITLSGADVANMTDANKVLQIVGDGGTGADSVALTGGWTQGPDVNKGGVDYNVFNNGLSGTTVEIQDDIDVTFS